MGCRILTVETFKFTGFLLAKRSLKLTRKIDFIMIAGLIGLVYGVVEKAVLGNIAAVIVGLLIPMHITWQFNQGGHWFEYERTRSPGELLMATAVPFLFHGCWDTGLDLVGDFLGMEESTAAQVADPARSPQQPGCYPLPWKAHPFQQMPWSGTC